MGGLNSKLLTRRVTNQNIEGIAVEVFNNLRLDTGLMIKSLEGKVSLQELMHNVITDLNWRFLKDGDFDSEEVHTVWDWDAYSDEYCAKVATNWEAVKENIDDYTEGVREFLKTRGIEFKKTEIKNGVDESAGGVTENTGDDSNTLDFAADMFKTKAKESSPTEIKLLFGFITDDAYNNDIERRTNSELKRNPSKQLSPITGLPMLSKTDWFNTVLKATSNKAGLDQMRVALYELAIKHPPLVRPYKAIFGELNAQPTAENVRLQILFEKAFNKQTVEAQLLNVKGGSTRVMNSDSAREYNQIINDFLAKVTTLPFVKTDEYGNYFFNEKEVLEAYKKGGSKELNALDFLNTIGFDFPKDIFNNLSVKEQGEVVLLAGQLHNALSGGKFKTRGTPVSTQGIDNKALRELAKLYVKGNNGLVATQRLTVDGETAQRYVNHNALSYRLSLINQVTSREQLLQVKPFYATDPFTQHSLLLKEDGIWFGKEKDGFTPWKTGVQKMKVSVLEGIRGANGKAIPSKKVTKAVRFQSTFFANLAGHFNFVTAADSNQDWGTRMGTEQKPVFYINPDLLKVSGAATAEMKKIFTGYLHDEIELIKDFKDPNRSKYAELNKKRGDGKIGEQLRFFRDLLGTNKALVEKIEKYANGKGVDANLSTSEFVKTVADEMSSALGEYLNTQVKRTGKFLKDSTLLEELSTGTYIWHGFPVDARKMLDRGQAFYDESKNVWYTEFSKADVENIIRFREANNLINGIEMFKLSLGDPAMTPNIFKRAKTFLSGKDFTYTDTIGKRDLNTVLHNKYNKVGDYILKPGQTGYHVFKDTLGIFTHADTIYASANHKELPDSYQHTNADDAHSKILLLSYRETMIKQGSWNDEREAQFQHDEALFRKEATERFNNGEKQFEEFAYKDNADDKELEKVSNEILAKGNPEVKNAFYIIKQLGSGQYDLQDRFVSYILKTSTIPLSWELSKGTFNEDLYLGMRKSGNHYSGPNSQLKTGNLVNAPKLFNENGEFNITADHFKEHGMPISYSDFGKIVETSGQHDTITLASQGTKIDHVHLFSQGIPNDFMRDKDVATRKAAWGSLKTDEERNAASNFYKLYDTKNKCLSALAVKGLDAIKDTIGVSKVNGNYQVTDATKLVDFLNQEIARRKLPENMKRALDTYLNPLTGNIELVNAIETMSNPRQLEGVINSLLDKHIHAPKMNGKSLILASVVGFEKRGDIKVETINGKKVLTSSRLKFYSKGEDGKTLPMEVMMTNFMYDKLKKKSKLSDVELMKHLMTDEGQELLKGIGFRIPTNGMNSIDTFKVVPFDLKYNEDGTIDYENSKMFVPDTYGDMVIVPGELTVKAGSDFDGDRLYSYLRNFYIDNSGYPRNIEFIFDLSERGLKKIWEQKKQLFCGEESFHHLLSRLRKHHSLEEFITKYKDETDPYTINSQEAIENRYQDNIRDIVLDPYMFDKLVAPNSTEELSNYKEKLEDVAYTYKSPAEKYILADARKNAKTPKAIDLVDSLMINKVSDEMITGKTQVGIGAQANTSNSLMHSAANPIILDPAKVQFKDAELNMLPFTIVNNEKVYDYSIRLPHNSVPVDGKKYPTVSGAEIDSHDIAKKISMVIELAVDAANNPALMQIYPSKELLSTGIGLIRLQAPLNYITLFLNQPIIKEYAKALENANARRVFDAGFKRSNESIIEEIIKKFEGGSPVQLTGMLSKDAMVNALAKYEGGRDLKAEEKAYQIALLKEYFKYKLFADHLLANQLADYSNMSNASREAVYMKEKAFEGTKNNVWGEASKMAENNFIKTRRSTLTEGAEMLKGLYAKTTGYIKPLWDAFNRKGISMSPDDIVAVMKKANTSFIDYLTQVFYQPLGDKSLNQYIRAYFLTDNFVNSLYRAKEDNEERKGTSSYNYALSLVRVEKGTTSADTRVISLSTKPNDVEQMNMLTSSFEELKQTRPALYNNIVTMLHLQSGTTDTRLGFNKFIPVEDYKVAIKAGIDALKTNSVLLNKFVETNQFYKNNWADDKIVPTLGGYLKVPVTLGEHITKSTDGIAIQEGKYGSSNPAVKVMRDIDPSTRKPYPPQLKKNFEKNNITIKSAPELYRRLEDEDGNPIKFLSKDKKTGKDVVTYVFKQINALGDGSNLQEYYTDNRPSVRNLHFKVDEINN